MLLSFVPNIFQAANNKDFIARTSLQDFIYKRKRFFIKRTLYFKFLFAFFPLTTLLIIVYLFLCSITNIILRHRVKTVHVTAYKALLVTFLSVWLSGRDG